MPAAALALTLAAAILHATWNLLLARAKDIESATAVALVAGTLTGVPVAIVAWNVHEAVLPYLTGASLFQLAYIALLAGAYARADMSLVYPLARGVAPVFVLIVSVAALGATASPEQASGVAVIACGVVLVRGLRLEAGSTRGILLALAVAGCIAGYTLLDKRAIRHASPLSYFELEMLVPTIVYAGVVARIRGRAAIRVACTGTNAIAGIAMVFGYALILLALERAGAPAVSAVRESSVVIATGLAAVVLHERVTPARVLGSAVVVAGIALIALG
ncbi:MAG TPA: DMT family transporter [Gaiellales bacterium]